MSKVWKIKAFVDNSGIWSRWIERQGGVWTLCIPCAGGAERWIDRREISRKDVRELIQTSRPARQAYLAHGASNRAYQNEIMLGDMARAMKDRELVVVHASRAFIAKRIGFVEFKRIVRLNS